MGETNIATAMDVSSPSDTKKSSQMLFIVELVLSVSIQVGCWYTVMSMLDITISDTVLIPVLTILSFLLNDSPIGRLSFRQKLRGTWFITLYAAVILTLILTGVIPAEQIPYFFLDVAHMPVTAFLGCFAFIYSVAILLSHLLSGWNRKLSWLWFRGVAAA